MVGGRHRLLREGAQEERLFAPGADLSERARGTDEAVILEFGLFGRGDLKGRGRRRPGLRLAATFERELAVELVVMLRSVRAIAVGGRLVARRERGAAGPIITLGHCLCRTTAVPIVTLPTGGPTRKATSKEQMGVK